MLKFHPYTFLIGIFFLLYSFSAKGEEWESITRNLNPNIAPLPDTISSRHALSPSLTLWKGSLYAAGIYLDDHGVQQIYIKKLQNNAWEEIGKSQNKDTSFVSSTPMLAANENHLFLSWSEKNRDQVSQIYVKQWNGSEWMFLGSSLNVNPEKEAQSPVLALFKDTPYIAWNEAGEKGWTKLYVKHWDGGTWVMDGDGFGLENYHITLASSFIFHENKGYLVWPESTETEIFQIFYAVLEDGKWTISKEPLNHDSRMQAFNPSFTFWNNALYVIFQEKSKEGNFQLQLKHLTPNGWVSDTEKLKNSGKKAFNPVLVSQDQSLMIAWEEWDTTEIPKIAAQSFTPSGNGQVYMPLNDRSDHFGLGPVLATGKDEVYLAWKENNSDDLYQIQIKKYSKRNQ